MTTRSLSFTSGMVRPSIQEPRSFIVASASMAVSERRAVAPAIVYQSGSPAPAGGRPLARSARLRNCTPGGARLLRHPFLGGDVPGGVLELLLCGPDQVQERHCV